MNEQKPAISKFKDSYAVEWQMPINVGVIEDIEEQAKVKLDQMIENPKEFANILIMKPGSLVAVFYVICEDQIKERGLTERQFAKLFDRDTLDRATNALIEAMVTFSLRSSAGQTIRENLPRILNELDNQVKMKVEKILPKVLSDLHTNMPESAELEIPDPIHSGG